MGDQAKNNISRRTFFGAAAGVAGIAVASKVIPAQLSGASDISTKKIPFYGVHQAGITTPAQSNAIVAAFDLTIDRLSDLENTLKLITAKAQLLTQGIPLDEKTREYPPSDNLIDSELKGPNSLTITLGLGSTIFDTRFGLQDKKPIELAKMPRFDNDQLIQSKTHGDLVLQICANSAAAAIRSLRIIMKATRSSMVLRWMEEGFIQPNKQTSGGTSTRNLFGFKDGTANPDTADDNLMSEHVWVTKSSGEPSWAIDGSYMVVRPIRMFVEHWDRTSLSEQEAIIGRNKLSGAPLGSKNETDEPIFLSKPGNKDIAKNAHIRLANPRDKDSKKNIILRRGYNYSHGFDNEGRLDQGLIFVCYQKSLKEGFLTVQERLNGEAMEEYIKPIGGGFFFMVPGVQKGEYLGQGLFDALG